VKTLLQIQEDLKPIKPMSLNHLRVALKQAGLLPLTIGTKPQLWPDETPVKFLRSRGIKGVSLNGQKRAA